MSKTKADLERENAAQRDIIAALGEEIDALRDIFTAAGQSTQHPCWVVGYIQGIGTDNDGIGMLRLYAATLRKPACPVISETGTTCTADHDPHPLPHRDVNGFEWDVPLCHYCDVEPATAGDYCDACAPAVQLATGGEDEDDPDTYPGAIANGTTVPRLRRIGEPEAGRA